MGQDCSSCCTTAEEGKQEINDDENDFKMPPGYQNHGIGGTKKMSSVGTFGQRDVSQDRSAL
jgi:hypothetical protein